MKNAKGSIGCFEQRGKQEGTAVANVIGIAQPLRLGVELDTEGKCHEENGQGASNIPVVQELCLNHCLELCATKLSLEVVSFLELGTLKQVFFPLGMKACHLENSSHCVAFTENPVLPVTLVYP